MYEDTEWIYVHTRDMIDPDMIEDVSHGDLLDERNVYAAVKHTESGSFDP